MKEKGIPVVVFAYNRRDKLEKCIKSLEANDTDIKEKTDLYIFLDGAKTDLDEKTVKKTREFVDEYIKESSFSKVYTVMSTYNKGLAKSIVDGVTSVVNLYGKVIVVEDDLVLSLDFLRYMNNALDFYSEYSEIGQVNGYTYPIKALSEYDKDVYFLRKGDCWGWGTWKEYWNNAEWYNVDFEEYRSNWKIRREFEKTECNWDTIMMNQYYGSNDSWAIRWVYHLYRNQLYSVYPRISKVRNEGFDGSGTHNSIDKFSAELNNCNDTMIMEKELFVDERIAKQAARYPRPSLLTYFRDRCRIRIKELIG